MNFKSPYPWAEKGRICNLTVIISESSNLEPEYKQYLVEILDYDYDCDKNWCKCRLLENDTERFVFIEYLEPIYSIDEVMQYADKTIIEEHWVDFNGDKRVLYLKKFSGEYFRVDECENIRKMKKIKI